MNYRILVCAASALVLGGCLGGSDKDRDETTTSFENGLNSDLPSTLKKDEDIMLNPLQKQLKFLTDQQIKIRQELAEYEQRKNEYSMRTDEMRNRLTGIDAQVKKVNSIISMLDSNSQLLNKQGNAGSGLSADVPSISDNGPLTGDLPALSSGNNTLGGGPQMSLAPSFNETATPRNDLTSPAGGLPGFGNTSGNTPSFEAAPAFPVASLDEPTVSDAAPGSVWKTNSVPALQSQGKILICDGKGLDSQLIISLGRKDGITPGMLFEADSADGKRNVLVVTRVYDANAEAKLHPQFSSGNLANGIMLKKLDRLPQ